MFRFFILSFICLLPPLPDSRSRSLRNPQFGSSFNGQDGFKIVVEESNTGDDNDPRASVSTNQSTPRDSIDTGSPLNPYLLSPWRETRKHSLPSQQVTEGITASQVRRLSERGGEGSGPSPKVRHIYASFHFHTILLKIREKNERRKRGCEAKRRVIACSGFLLVVIQLLPSFFIHIYSLRRSFSLLRIRETFIIIIKLLKHF